MAKAKVYTAKEKLSVVQAVCDEYYTGEMMQDLNTILTNLNETLERAPNSRLFMHWVRKDNEASDDEKLGLGKMLEEAQGIWDSRLTIE